MSMNIVRDKSLPRIDYDHVMSLTKASAHAWTEKDAILYALGIGMGADPLDETELRFVYEDSLKVFPTFPVVVGFHGGALEDIGIDYRYVLHGEHAVTLHRPFPAEQDEFGKPWLVQDTSYTAQYHALRHHLFLLQSSETAHQRKK